MPNITMHGRILAMDIEANGLLEKVTKTWCICAKDMNTDEIFVYHNFPQFDYARVTDPYDDKEYVIPKRNGTFEDGIKFVMGAGQLICHNYFGYDYFVMKKFFPYFTHDLSIVRDTLIESKVQWYERPTPKGCKGQHGLQAWGVRQGINKPEVKDWSTMDAFKLHRCLQDIEIQAETARMLSKERTQIESKFDTNLDECMLWEARYRYDVTIQELDGALVDKPFMEACVKELGTLSEELRIRIEPKLPYTVKFRSGKITGNEVATTVGLPKVPPVLYEIKERQGVKKRYPIKEWYKPVTKWANEEKVKLYSAVNEVLGIDTDFVFSKLKEAREWMKLEYPEANLQKGWKYPSEETIKKVLNQNAKDWWETDEVDFIGGMYTKVEFIKSTMSQHAVVKRFLLSLGWIPTEWNVKKDSKGKAMRDGRGQLIKSSPKLTEDSFDSLPEGVGLDIAHYNTYSHRLKFIANPTDNTKGLLNRIRPDGRVSCGVNDFSTATGRSSHSNWVNAAGVGALYGEETRKIIIAPKKHLLVGADMKSAQLSIAAYYANNRDYYQAVADGQEVIKDEDGNEIYIGESGHCVNARMFELVSNAQWELAKDTQDPELLHFISLMRKKSKGGTFAVIFGASGKKVAQTLGIDEALGNEKKNAFLNNIGLDGAIDTLKETMHKYKRGSGGYLELPFGFWVWCGQEHKVLNYLVQGTEAACQKVAVLYFKEWLNKEVKAGNIKAKKVLDYHDEFLVESHEDCADEVGKMMCVAYKHASDRCAEWHREKSKIFPDINFAFDLNGGFKTGINYLAVH